MKILDWTLPRPEENLALDEALMELSERHPGDEVLRFWEPQNYFVVLGYSNKMKTEVKLDSCKKDHVPVLRRVSGGGTVLQGPGCLNYALVLRNDRRDALRTITSTNREILGRHAGVLSPCVGPVEIRGATDLTLGLRKFSGNSQRRRRKHLLFHGTFLLNFDIPQVEKYLTLPSREPAYRNRRAHADFLTNLDLTPEALKEKLAFAWKAEDRLLATPPDDFEKISEKYRSAGWNERFV